MFQHTEVPLYAPWIQKFHQNFEENGIIVVYKTQNHSHEIKQR